MSSTRRSALAALLLCVPVLGELLLPLAAEGAFAQELFALSQVAGWALVWSVCRATPRPATRAAGLGRAAVLWGCGLEVAFGAVYAVTAVDGEPLEAAFVLFLLGFATLLVGSLLWGRALARGPRTVLAAAGVLGALAVLVGVDPWHDVCLLSAYAAWGLLGPALERASAQRRPGGAPLGSRPAEGRLSRDRR